MTCILETPSAARRCSHPGGPLVAIVEPTATLAVRVDARRARRRRKDPTTDLSVRSKARRIERDGHEATHHAEN